MIKPQTIKNSVKKKEKHKNKTINKSIKLTKKIYRNLPKSKEKHTSATLKKHIKLKEKITNHLMRGGEKHTGETLFFKSMKSLQKQNNKKTNEILKLSILFAVPVFKIKRVTQKRRRKNKLTEIPVYIMKSSVRVSLAIKFIILACKQKKFPVFSNCLYDELLLNSQNKGVSSTTKNKAQELFLKRNYRSFSRWRF